MINLSRASIKAIAAALNVTRYQAQNIKDDCGCSRRPKSVDVTLDYINEVTQAHGVEAIRSTINNGGYYQDIAALYVNMGDVYITTVLYDTKRRQWYLTDIGTWAERQGDKII